MIFERLGRLKIVLESYRLYRHYWVELKKKEKKTKEKEKRKQEKEEVGNKKVILKQT